jgi:hypothetical protein
LVTMLPTTWAGGPPRTGAAIGWSTTATMSTPRQYHTATLLPNGKVLIAGGCSAIGFYDCSAAVARAEVYDPATRTCTVTGSLHTARGADCDTAPERHRPGCRRQRRLGLPGARQC